MANLDQVNGGAPTRAMDAARRVRLAILSQCPRVKEGSLLNAAEFEADLGLDTLDKYQVVLWLEAELGIQTTDAEVEGVRTVRDLIAVVERKTKPVVRQ
jgi:acyl carrier protein